MQKNALAGPALRVLQGHALSSPHSPAGWGRLAVLTAGTPQALPFPGTPHFLLPRRERLCSACFFFSQFKACEIMCKPARWGDALRAAKGCCVPWSAALEDSSLVAWGGRTQTWCILRVPKSAPRVCFRGNSSVDSRRVPVHALVLTQRDQPQRKEPGYLRVQGHSTEPAESPLLRRPLLWRERRQDAKLTLGFAIENKHQPIPW